MDETAGPEPGSPAHAIIRRADDTFIRELVDDALWDKMAIIFYAHGHKIVSTLQA